jgi:hypothetical protein
MQTLRMSEEQKLEMSFWVGTLARWRVIAHHTFVWESSLWAAQKSYEKFMDREVRDVSYFYAIEENPSRDGHHVHALWADCEGVHRSAIWEKWKGRYGRNRIEPVRSSLNVVEYCAKYVTKEGAWWNARILQPALPFGDSIRSKEAKPLDKVQELSSKSYA